MKKIFILPGLLILLQLLPCSCTSQKDIIYLNSQLNALYRQTKKEGKRVEIAIREIEQTLVKHEAELKELKEQKEQKGLSEAIRAQESMLSELYEIIRAQESKLSELEQALKE